MLYIIWMLPLPASPQVLAGGGGGTGTQATGASPGGSEKTGGGSACSRCHLPSCQPERSSRQPGKVHKGITEWIFMQFHWKTIALDKSNAIWMNSSGFLWTLVKSGEDQWRPVRSGELWWTSFLLSESGRRRLVPTEYCQKEWVGCLWVPLGLAAGAFFHLKIVEPQ